MCVCVCAHQCVHKLSVVCFYRRSLSVRVGILYLASVHCWLSGAVSVGVQVQPVLSPVAVISGLRGIISSLQLS